MKNLRRAGYFLKGAVLNLTRHPLYSTVGILTLCVSLILVGFLGLFMWKADQVIEEMSGGLKLTVYLEDEITPGAVEELTRVILDNWPEVDDVTFHTHEEDRARNRNLLPRELLEELDPSLIPAQPFLEVQLAISRVTEDRIDKMIEWFRSLAQVQGVDEVLFGADKISVAYSLIQRARNLGVFIAAVIVLAALFFVVTTTRLIVEGRRKEIQVLLLVGATKNFVRIPHYIEGVLQGLMAGALAFIVVWLLQHQLLSNLRAEALLQVPVNLLPTGMGVWFILGGGVLGLLGSALGIARYLRLSQ